MTLDLLRNHHEGEWTHNGKVHAPDLNATECSADLVDEATPIHVGALSGPLVVFAHFRLVPSNAESERRFDTAATKKHSLLVPHDGSEICDSVSEAAFRSIPAETWGNSDGG